MRVVAYSCNVNGRRLVLIRNRSAVPFITGDQPVVNIHADGETAPELMSIYYPLSPELALFFYEPEEAAPIPVAVERDDLAADLNLRIARTSQSQIYASTAEVLEDVKGGLQRAQAPAR